MHIPVLEREVRSLPQAVVALVLRYEFLWSIQSFRRARFIFLRPLGSGRDPPVGPSRTPDGLLGGLVLLSCDEVLLPLL